MQDKFSFLWHDYETWGNRPRADRPSQFAAIRTDYDLNEIDDDMMLYCRPSDDFLPHPEAVLITGLTPQMAYEKGVCEAEFFHKIHGMMSKPGTCGVGYNTLRFDDEVTRFGFYRNYFDPYAREWQNSNSRWDILDLVRMAFALRPEGIEWPENEEGRVSFKLEHLTKANGIEHQGAHDALSDVRATIALAKLIKLAQPRLFDFYFKLRVKSEVSALLNVQHMKPLLHISGMYPVEQGCIAPIIPLMQHPINSNEIIVFDARQDPEILLSMDSETIQQRLYTKTADLSPDEVRPALKSIHINKSPALAPKNTLNDERAEMWSIDWNQVKKHHEQLLAATGLQASLTEVYRQKADFGEVDVDQALYNGFISRDDRSICDRIIAASPEELSQFDPTFKDERLQRLFFRYRARNWPELLNEDEQNRWRQFCQARLVEGEFGNDFTLTEFNASLERCAEQPLSDEQQYQLKQLINWIGN